MVKNVNRKENETKYKKYIHRMSKTCQKSPNMSENGQESYTVKKKIGKKVLRDIRKHVTI